jgi:hypothetical protein
MDLPVPDLPSAKAAKKPSRKPPDERFWKRYSRHHELPLSVASSVLVHALGIGALALILTGAILTLLGMKTEPLQVEGIQVAGGSGIEEGIGTGPANGEIPSGPESLKQAGGAEAKKPDPDPTRPPPQLDPVQDKTSDRLLPNDPAPALEHQGGADQRLRDRIRDLIAGKGKGNVGGGGGEGRGQGTGKGNNRGPGLDTGNLTIRQKRQLRWSMVFDTRSGEDYLSQLAGLGAILAVPSGNDEYVFYRNLSLRPPQSEPGQLWRMNQIYWTDDQAHSVRNLSTALGLTYVPGHIIAFFPVELEKKLLEKERQAYSGNEENIRETNFRIQRKGGRYEPVVSSIDVGRGSSQ